jgi:hypothetical protein
MKNTLKIFQVRKLRQVRGTQCKKYLLRFVTKKILKVARK